MEFTWAVGFTVMVKVFAGPGQVTPPFVKEGVTVMLALTGDPVELVAIKGEMFPVPLAAKPMLVLLFVQVYVVLPPVFTVVNVIKDVLEPLQTTWLSGWTTWPNGLTVIVKVSDGPAQLTIPIVYVGVTVIVAITGSVVVFTAGNEAMSPFPDEANPILGVSFVQE